MDGHKRPKRMIALGSTASLWWLKSEETHTRVESVAYLKVNMRKEQVASVTQRYVTLTTVMYHLTLFVFLRHTCRAPVNVVDEPRRP